MSQAPRIVLIADDEPDIGRLLARIMHPLNITPIVVTNGSDALAAAQQHGTELDAAFIDIQMPDINGIVVAQNIRQQLPNLLIVLMSAGLLPQQGGNIAQLRLAAFLAKPFSIDAVRVLLGQLGLAGAPPPTAP